MTAHQLKEAAEREIANYIAIIEDLKAQNVDYSNRVIGLQAQCEEKNKEIARLRVEINVIGQTALAALNGIFDERDTLIKIKQAALNPELKTPAHD